MCASCGGMPTIVLLLMYFLDFIAAVPDPHGNGHKVIVDQAGECSEQTHQQGQVAHLQKGVHAAGSQRSLEETQEGANQEKDKAVADITKHNAEEEREGHDRENRRVYLLIVRHTISINDLLEDPCHLVLSK
jgi:hypothetical protein